MSNITISDESARLPQIPQTSITDAQVRPVVEAVRTIFNKRAFSSDPLDRWVTWRDMVANGVVTYEAGGNTYSGGGRPSFFISNPEEEDLTPPPAPTNLQASGALLNIILTWDPPKYRNHAYTEIWRSGSNNLGTAVLIGTTQAASYADPVGSGLTYYYWIRYVSIANITGSYNSTLGVEGKTSPDPGYLLELLTGEITESQLYRSLGDRIDLIEVNQTAIQTESEIREAQDESLASQITTVSAANSSNAAAILVEATARANGDGANATSISQVQARLDTGDYAAVKVQSSTSASKVTGLEAQYSVKVDVNGYVSGFGLSSTAINAVPFSNFVIRADRFSIASPSGPGITPIVPFVVNTTTQTINGVSVPPGVYMDAAFIKNGTITSAQIGFASIDDARIASVNATKLTAGSITAEAYIGSPNYVAGSQGWRISGNGFAEFSNVTVRGTVYATAGQFIGTLLGGAANGYTSGVGLYSGGNDAGTYRWRVGAPTGARIQWTGSTIEVYNGSNQLTLSSGGVTWDTVSGKPAFGALSYVDSITAGNVGTYIATGAIGEAYIGTITAGKIDSRNLTIKDAAGNVILGAGNNLDWSRVANQPANIYNSNITISSNGVLSGGGGGSVSLSGLGAGNFAFLSQINSGNIGTYIATAAIGGAYIQNAAIGTALIADAAIVTAKIGSAQIDTLRIAGNAVTTMGAISGTSNQTFYLNAPYGGQVVITLYIDAIDIPYGGDGIVGLYVDGGLQMALSGSQVVIGYTSTGESSGYDMYGFTPASRTILVSVGAGNHSFTVNTFSNGVANRFYTAVGLLAQR